MTAPIRILLVDDDVPTRVGLTAILSSESDLEVVGEAADGLQGCSMAEELKPDVVLMDVQLPGIDGIEATRRITATADGSTRVLVLTTFASDVFLYHSMEAGASGFLLKRARAEDIVQAVRAVAGGNALPTPASTTSVISKFAPLKGEGRTFVPPLTERETAVLVLVARGLSNRAIARDLGISIETVRTHIKHVYSKCGARDRVQAVMAAYESGLVDLNPEGETS